MSGGFQKDSDMFKIPFLRALLSGNIDPSLKKKYNIIYTKSQGQPIFLEFMEKCLTAIVKLPPDGNWKSTIAGKLITATGPGNQGVFIALKKLCELRIDKFISAASDQSQCQYVGIVNNKSGCKYNLNDTFPGINNGAVNPSRNLWNSRTWCDNCWLCGLPVGESGYPYTKQCEHILPYLTGSILLGTATNNTLVLSEDTKKEYGQSHAICNMFKNQGEFIKFDSSSEVFTPDIKQICNYIQELTGIKLDETSGLELWKSDIVSTKTIDSFTQVFEKTKNGDFQRSELAEDMYKTITKVIKTICTGSLSKENISTDLMAKLLYTAILNFLVDSQVRAALILTKGVVMDFRNTLQGFYKRLFPKPPDTSISGAFALPFPKPFTPDEIVGLITSYRSPFTTKRITERLKNYIDDDKVPKPRKYMILAKSLYDSIISMIPTSSFGSSRRISAPDQKERDKISKSIQKRVPVKKLQGGAIIDILKEDQELLPYYTLLDHRVFKYNLSNIINELSNITYGDLYSKLTYTLNGKDYIYDDEFRIENGKIILPALVYTVYENFDRMSSVEVGNFIGVVNEFFPLPMDYLKIFSAYIYGITIFSLLDYDLDRLKIKLQKGTEIADFRFGRKTNKLSSMSNEELKTKLKSVGINVTKLSSKGKRLNLTHKEMEKKANLFKNLQLRAKKIGIKLMYKSRTRGYIYKTYTRLMNELNKMKTKTTMKFG